ncbi:MAG: PAS domain-containing protein [Halodesulfurarchaeum sp.]
MRGDTRVLLAAPTETVATELADSLARDGDKLAVTPIAGASAALEAIGNEIVDCVVATDGLETGAGLDFHEAVRERAPGLPLVFVPEGGPESLAERIESIVAASSNEGPGAETRYRDLFAAMNEGMAIHELVTDESGAPVDYRILEVNRRYEEILGKDRDAVEGSLATAVYNAADPPYLKRFARVVETGEPIEFETEYEPLEKHFRISAFRPEPGRFATLFSDVTDRVHAQRNLEAQTTKLEEEVDRRKAAETRYKSLFENNPVVIWEEDYTDAKAYVDEIAAEHPDVEGYLADNPGEIQALFDRVEIIDINRKALEYYDAESKAELIDNLGELMTEESLSTNRRMWQAVADGETHFRDETVSRTLEGRRRDEILEYRVPATGAKDYSRVYVTSIDITERKRREQELKRLSERLELALEGAQLGVWDWDMETDTVYRDGRWADMLGYESGAVTDDLDAVNTLLHPEDVRTHTGALKAHVEGDADLYECVYRLRTAEGTWKWIQNVGKVVEWGGDGTPKRAVGIHRDIDEKRRTRERLERNNELLKAVDRILRHNLHNDMNVIQGYAMTIESADDGELAGYAETIIETGDKLLNTVGKERAVVESLSDPLPIQSLDLVSIAESVVSVFERTHPTADVRFSAPDRLPVRAVETIGRAVEELIENAIVHADSEPTVDIEVGSDGTRGWIRVADTGPKIPEMEQSVLTDSAEITPLYHGSGFGLWLVNHVVNRSGGTLTFDERDPRGNVVTLEFRTPGSVKTPGDRGVDSSELGWEPDGRVGESGETR